VDYSSADEEVAMQRSSLRLSLAIIRVTITLNFLFLLTSCGTGGLPHTSQVTATVTPSQATVAPGGSVTLTGAAKGFTAAPIVQWYIQESKDIDFNNDCGFLLSTPPPVAGCPYGFVVFADMTTFPSSATYYAPSTPGTYHVTFEASQFTTFDHLTKTAQAVITVQ
jgi:hypothetical protein